MRIEVLGDFLGDDGLKIKDIPELSINHGEPEFSTKPAMIVVRKNLSKIGRQFFTFLNSEGCGHPDSRSKGVVDNLNQVHIHLSYSQT